MTWSPKEPQQRTRGAPITFFRFLFDDLEDAREFRTSDARLRKGDGYYVVVVSRPVRAKTAPTEIVELAKQFYRYPSSIRIEVK